MAPSLSFEIFAAANARGGRGRRSAAEGRGAGVAQEPEVSELPHLLL